MLTRLPIASPARQLPPAGSRSSEATAQCRVAVSARQRALRKIAMTQLLSNVARARGRRRTAHQLYAFAKHRAEQIGYQLKIDTAMLQLLSVAERAEIPLGSQLMDE